jgi:ADP-ribosylglycohydrolase
MSSPEVRYEHTMQTGPTSASAIEHPVVSSAIWAAWGDALGFITELTSSLGEVSRRSGGAKVENTVPWRRQMGGRFGPIVDLPAGTYSDDTQLRLAVSRSIRGNGRFDLESFSKIELPVFLSYEMRAGKGTRAAAYELMKRHVRWSANFFENERASYVNAGGNGAAMRIQPHVWSTPRYDPRYFIAPVASDAIVTHGHPRGVVGAVIHANALSSVLRRGEIPAPSVWGEIVAYARSLPETMSSNEALRERWLPTWEKTAGRRWQDAVEETIEEGATMVDLAQQALADGRNPGEAYRDLIIGLGGKKRETAGSGMIAAIASLAAAWMFREDPVDGLRVIANQLGTDTDTIATMAGALLGATGLAPPPGPLLDSDYIAGEAARMVAISEGQAAPSFPHPDPINWRPPRSLSDSVGTTRTGISVAGLGAVTSTDGKYELSGKDRSFYQWMTLDHGQTLLIKRRPDLKPLPAGALPMQRPSLTAINGSARQPGLFDERRNEDEPADSARGPGDLDAALQRVIAAGFDEWTLGHEMKRFAEEGVSRATEFAAAVAAVYQTQRGR